ncbi:MAG TPA: response regulator transcription factor [Verrucomicrobiales bacterium]|nr:response regulator transcription factor [Verrucomicrobiales bacterium]
MTTKPITIWLIEDNAAFSSIVVRLLNDVPDFTCPCAFSSAEAALKTLRHSTPDVILLDVDLPGINGITAIRGIKALAPDTSVVMLTVFDDQQKIYEAIGAGASGYLLKTSTEEEIAEAVRLAVEGGAPVHRKVAGSVWQMFAKMTGQGSDCGLTPRETEILRDAAQGLANKEIAQRRSMSTHTVDAHLRRIYQKLGVHTRTAAVAVALRRRLV